MRGARRVVAREVRDRPRDLQHAVVRARRPAEPLARVTQQRLARAVRAAERIGLAARQHVVGLALPRELPLARERDARGHGFARFAGGRRPLGQLGGRERGNLDLDVDPVEERPGQLAQIARGDVGRAAAAAARVAAPAARARIHRGDQLARRRKIRLQRGARDRDAAGLERLAQRLEHVPVEFRQFVEEQHAQVCERDLARLRRIAAADERGRARRVMRRAKRAPPPLSGREARAARRQDRGRRQRLVIGERRQEGGQARGEHRFARARRPDHQHVVAARGGDFERALRARLADHIGEIGRRCGGERVEPGRGDGGEPPVRRVGEVRAQRGQIGRAVHGHARHERRLGRARQRQVELGGVRRRRPRGRRFGLRGRAVVVRLLAARRAARHRERAAHRPQRARERQLARELAAVERAGRKLAARGENAERDRQIEAAGLLRQIGRREVDGDAPHGKLEPAVLQRGAHALAAFAHFEIGQPDDRYRATVIAL